ncbi:hypothetical protein DRQ09_03280 [candidate division KSB1 bacterium]|nr:MAG: hypothetical protein DRQ09_03280 [candidate division KSB1 bacterium]
METSAIVSFIIFGCIIWGGFVVSAGIAMKKEKRKKENEEN